ncbi:beta-1,6-N-acetylglucosaminyltransferase [Polaribacter batillariae]|uniref:beta-1,6-N-acetylglucosaminyltransferase n=1 Tax=Polaribacter batillariae TaxID=2808900 RepID=UPI0026766A5B|nr:beta-1,6-N-acetylglucosaminyltransferase [Polaribacter batillariae]
MHVDLKSNIEDFTSRIQEKNVFFIEQRVNCVWGDFSLVIATINLLQNVVKTKNKNSKILFLSGQDYPIKPLSKIDNFLVLNKSYEFIDLVMYKSKEITYQDRVLKFKINNTRKKEDIRYLWPLFKFNFKNYSLFLKLLYNNKITLKDLKSLLTFKRKSIFKEHYKGSNWFVFNYQTVVKILKYIEKNKNKIYNYYYYYYYTACADEQFFHTILKEIMIYDKSIKVLPSVHYIDWTRKNTLLPVTFKVEDLNLLINQPENLLFARKFDEKIDNKILDLIDTSINNKL